VGQNRSRTDAHGLPAEKHNQLQPEQGRSRAWDGELDKWRRGARIYCPATRRLLGLAGGSARSIWFGPKPILAKHGAYLAGERASAEPPPTARSRCCLIGSDEPSLGAARNGAAPQGPPTAALLLARVIPAGGRALLILPADLAVVSYQARTPAVGLVRCIEKAGQPWPELRVCCSPAGAWNPVNPERYTVVVPPGPPSQPWLMGWARGKRNPGAPLRSTDNPEFE